MRSKGTNPDEYLDGLDGWRREKVERLRELILESAPGLEETVRSGFLYYADEGDLLALAAQKNYVSLYVLAPETMTRNAHLLKDLDHGKGCIRFKARTEIPEAAMRTLLVAAFASPERDCAKG